MKAYVITKIEVYEHLENSPAAGLVIEDCMDAVADISYTALKPMQGLLKQANQIWWFDCEETHVLTELVEKVYAKGDENEQNQNSSGDSQLSISL